MGRRVGVYMSETVCRGVVCKISRCLGTDTRVTRVFSTTHRGRRVTERRTHSLLAYTNADLLLNAGIEYVVA
jgi:hypothetical protein